MTKKLLGLLVPALFCVGSASATTFTAFATCVPTGGSAIGNSVAQNGFGGYSPSITNQAVTCNASGFVVPVGDTLTEVDIDIQGDYSLGFPVGSTGTINTLNWTYTVGTASGPALAGTSTEQVLGAAGSSSYTFAGAGCTQFANTNAEDCQTTSGLSGGFIGVINMNTSASWTPGSEGVQANGHEDYSVTVEFTYTSPATVPEPASLLMIGGGLMGLGVLARRKRKV